MNSVRSCGCLITQSYWCVCVCVCVRARARACVLYTVQNETAVLWFSPIDFDVDVVWFNMFNSADFIEHHTAAFVLSHSVPSTAHTPIRLGNYAATQSN